MGTASQTMAGCAPPIEIRHIDKRTNKEKVYRIGMIDMNMLAKIERHLYARELASISPQRGLVSEEKYNADMDEASRKYKNDAFGLMSPIAQEYFKTQGGMLYLMELLFDAPVLELAQVLLAHKDEVIQAVHSILFESLGIDPVPEEGPTFGEGKAASNSPKGEGS